MMELFIMVNGRKINSMAKVRKLGLMEPSMKENIKMVKNMERDILYGLMGLFMKETF